VASTVLAPHRLTVDDVLRMAEAGILAETARVELVDGVLVEMNPIGPEHRGVVGWLTQHLARAGSERWDVMVQDMLVLDEGGAFVMPDVMLTPKLPRTELATSALLVIEVAQTSHARDQEKAIVYARADVPEYWIVDIATETVVVHRSPSVTGYGMVTAHGVGATVVPLAPDAPPVPVGALLGKEPSP